MLDNFIKKAKLVKNYVVAKRETEKWLKIFNKAADEAVSYEDFVLNVVAPCCNAEAYMRHAERQAKKLKEC